jgi:heterodisulfide reductase subunit C
MEKDNFIQEIQHSNNIKVNKCYQCGKCSAGCPLATEMDYPPSMVMRMLQTEDKALETKLLQSKTIWLCLSCEMCYGRCPMEIDIPTVMDFLRDKSIKQNLVNKEMKDVVKFHEAFLHSIESSGRLSEFGLVLDYKMKTGHLMQDVTTAPTMFAKGKLHFFPEGVKDKKNIKNIFKKTLKK